MNGLMSWIIRGAAALNLLAFLADEAWLKEAGSLGYFGYTIASIGGIPYWLFATLVFLTINGAASLFFARISFRASVLEGQIRGDFPVPQMQLLGVNILLIPFLILLFIPVSALGL